MDLCLCILLILDEAVLWIESEDQLGVKVNIFTNVTSEFRSLCVQTL